MKPRVIGFCGKKGSGKNFVAGILAGMIRDKGKSATCHAFADPIKRYCNTVLDIPESLLWGDDYAKSTETKYKWSTMPEELFIGPMRHMRILALLADRKFLTVREVLQIVGTDLGRRVWGEDIWIQSMRRLICQTSADYFLITDVRFPNEANVVRENGGKLWMIKGRGKEGDSHSTENSIDGCVPDVVILNEPTSTPESLPVQIDASLGAFYGSV